MRRRSPSRLLALIGSAALAAQILTGCTGGGAPASGDAQSVPDACAAVGGAVADAVERVQSLDVTDPAAAAASLTELAERLDAAGAAVHNADVAAILPDLQRGFTTAADAVQGVAAGDLGRLASLQSATADIQSAFGRFARLCPPA